MKKIGLLMIMMAVTVGATFAQKEKKEKPGKEKPAEGIFAKFETSAGNFTLELFYEKVPMTSANFIALAEGKQPNNAKPLGTPYFDGIKFHRVISKANGDGQDFMIQGGDPDGTGRGGPGYSFKDEFVTGLKHDVPGILSMANAGAGTNGSQFFVTILPTPWLDNKHTVFGKVTEGQDVVNNMKVNTVINKVSIIRVGKLAKKFDAVKTFNELSGGVKASNPKPAEPKEKKKRNKQQAEMKELVLIETILQKFGPRRAGSKAEFEAQAFFAQELQKICTKVDHELFEGALRAKFLALRIFCVVYILNLVLVLYSPLAAFFLALINSVVFFLHFNSYRHILDFLYPKIKSSNVIGTIEPQGEVKQTVIFSGHMDSTPEFIWWYYLKNTGVKLMLLVGVSFVFIPVFYALIAFADFQLTTIGIKIAYIFFLCIAPLSAVFFFIHGKKVVPGAQDNLSGVSVAYGAAQQLLENGKSKLQHTRIKIISFGSEETGLRGSTAYVLKHREELQQENAVCVNADGIIALEHINVIKAEPACWVSHDKETAHHLQQTFKENGVDAQMSTLPIGATDAASFSRYGIKAVSIVAQPLNGLHPTYHTRLDTIEWLSQPVLEKTSSVMAQFAIKLDQKLNK